MFCIELVELEVLASCVGCPLPGLGDFVTGSNSLPLCINKRIVEIHTIILDPDT